MFCSRHVLRCAVLRRNVFYRERAAGMYTAMPFAIAQGNVELPYLVVQVGATVGWAAAAAWYTAWCMVGCCGVCVVGRLAEPPHQVTGTGGARVGPLASKQKAPQLPPLGGFPTAPPSHDPWALVSTSTARHPTHTCYPQTVIYSCIVYWMVGFAAEAGVPVLASKGGFAGCAGCALTLPVRLVWRAKSWRQCHADMASAEVR